ncbi:MAG: ParA family protein [Clostridia bacterium]|nr:ParA family protein [Clostridia bacterium]
MSYIISFANQKGGVGKTTSAVNIATMLAVLRKKVLLIDLDPQGSATSGVGIQKNSAFKTSYDVIIGACSIKEAIVKTKYDNLSVVCSNVDLAAADFELTSQDNRAYFLKNQLDLLKEEDLFDYILIDCPPTLGMTTINALSASNGIIIPIQCEFFALEGLSQLMFTIKKIKEKYNRRLHILGILVTMYQPRLKLASSVYAELQKYYEPQLFKTKISRCVALSEAPSFGKPIYYYARYSRASLEYQDVAKEIIERTFGG